MIYNKDIKAKLYTYMKMVLGMRDYRRGWMKGDCPYCGKHDKFGVNLFLNRSNCFSCGPKSQPFYLVMDLEKLTHKSEVFKVIENNDILDYYEKPIDNKVKDFQNLELPEGFKLLSLGNNQLAKSARSYIRLRGFDPDEMSLKGWGYGSVGKYYGYLIIPIYLKGKLVYFTSRRFLGNGPKFLNLELETNMVGKNMIIYNHEALFIYNKVRLVESIMNAETLGDNAIAINGKKLSSFQFNQLIKSPATHFTILFDHDAWEDTLNLCLKLVPFKNVKPVYFEDSKDVNDLGRKETYKKILKSKYLSYNEIIKLRNERPIYTHNGE